MTKVLVTGATGFIGTRLCERLSLIQRVTYRALVRSFTRANRIARLGAEMTSGDMADRDSLERALAGCDTVAHLAHGDDRHGPRHAKTLLSALRQAKVRRLVYVSSIAVHGPDPGPESSHEDTAPIRHWGESYCDSKATQEQLFREAIRRGDFEGVILRPAIVYGPYSPFVLAVIARAKAGDFSILDGGSGVCNAVYVDDVCDAIAAALTTREGLGKALFINGDKAVTWGEFNAVFAKMIDPHANFPSLSSSRARKHLEGLKPSAKSNLKAALGLLGSAGFHRELGRVPVLNAIIRGTKQYLGDELGEERKLRLKIAVQGPRRAAAQPAVGGWPDSGRILRETCRAEFSNRLAREVLPWSPKYDLSTGAAMTQKWLEFARYIPNPEDAGIPAGMAPGTNHGGFAQ